MRLFLLPFLYILSIVRGFLIQGTWLVNSQKDVKIRVLHDIIDIEMDGTKLRAKELTWNLNSDINLKVGGLDVIVYPSDWYNFTKYSKYISLYQKVLKTGASVAIDVLDTNKIIINVTIDDKKSPPIKLERTTI